MEIVKLWQVIFLNWDKHFYSPRTNKRLICRALNLNEDLGQIQYVFSDKTGTLTENEMIFRRCNINSHEYPHSPGKCVVLFANVKVFVCSGGVDTCSRDFTILVSELQHRPSLHGVFAI